MKSFTAALIGRPNSGKSTLFNKLTKEQQFVGNWSGVTVASKTGKYFYNNNKEINFVDLPGCFSLVSSSGMALDEKITYDYIISNKADIYICVIDINNFHNDLYLILQLLEQTTKPVILALNKVSKLQNTLFNSRKKFLEEELKAPVVVINSKLNIGLEELVRLTLDCVENKHINNNFYPNYLSLLIKKYIIDLELKDLPSGFKKDGAITRIIEGDYYLQKLFWNEILNSKKIGLDLQQLKNLDIEIAKLRHAKVKQILDKIYTHSLNQSLIKNNKIEQILDRLFLNRLLGLPIFLFIMYLMFVFSINIGGAFQDFFDLSSQAIFIEGIRNIANYLNFPDLITSILAEGVGRGINVTISFIPVLFCMFFALSFLETSGYISRASFLIDKFMRILGLPGKAFVPMIVGFGCNVPAVLGARTLDKKNDRIITILMAPFMSCSARLAIYTVFVAAFFSSYGQNVIFSLYLIGITVAILTGLLLRNTLLRGEESSLVMELPSYNLPSLWQLLKHAGIRLKNFISNAIKLIVPFCMVIGALGSIKNSQTEYYLLDKVGKSIAPIFKPMGISEDNWPAVVGLLSGTVGKEVMIGTLNSLYINEYKSEQLSNSYDVPDVYNDGQQELKITAKELLYEAFASIPENLSEIKSALFNPMIKNAPDENIGDGVLGIMYIKFNGPIAAFSYLLFVLLYFPCISVVVATARELNKAWAVFSVFWSTGMAYIVATLFYQIATFFEHPFQSISWVASIGLFCFIGIISLLKYVQTDLNKNRQRVVPIKLTITDTDTIHN